MVRVPAVAPVMEIEHEPDVRVQLAGLGRVTVPLPDSVKVTVPVGDESVTVAVQVLVSPMSKDVGVQETVVVVDVNVVVEVTVEHRPLGKEPPKRLPVQVFPENEVDPPLL
jgi:hypothetical protein